jgi:hypothetical protein
VKDAPTSRRPELLGPILWGGLAAGVGDSILALVLYRVPLTLIYQSVASGLMGRAAYRGGLTSAALGLVLHFFIATSAAAVYIGMAVAQPVLHQRPVPCGLTFGVAVYFFMKYVVLPLSAVTRLTPFDPAAMIGHAVLVGVPIALIARKTVSVRQAAPADGGSHT